MPPEQAVELTRPRASRAAGFALLGAIVLSLIWVGAQAVEWSLRPAPPKVGEIAPAFTATDLEGRTVSLEALRGKVVVLDFYSMWCVGCAAFFPIADRIDRAYADQGVVWLGVHDSEVDTNELRRFLDDRSVGFATLIDRGAMAKQYGIYATPSYIVIDRAGRVRAIHHAVASEGQLLKAIEELLRA